MIQTDLGQSSVLSSIDGNICRCTGYRPILDAFKSFAGIRCSLDLDTDGLSRNMVPDIEDLGSR